MAEVTVSAGTIESYSGGLPRVYLRIYCNKSFGTPEGEVIQAGQNKSQNFYKQILCTVGSCIGGSNDCINFPEFIIDSTTDGGPSDSSYTLSIFAEDGDYIGLVTNSLIIPPTPNPTTLGALMIYSSVDGPEVDPTTYTKGEVDGKINALTSAAVKATDSIYGTVKLSVPAALASVPIAVGINDPLISHFSHAYFLESYATLALAIAAIGSTQPVQLYINCPYTETTDVTVPVNVQVVIVDQGFLTVASGKTVNILNFAGYPAERCFGGTGRVILGPGSTARGEFLAEWWTGKPTTADYTFQLQQIMDSAAQNVNPRTSLGAIIRFGRGTWHFSDITQPNLVTMVGIGNSIDGGAYGSEDSGTTLKLYNLAAACVLRFPAGGYFGQRLHGMNISIGDSATASCLLIEGDLTSGLGMSASLCTFQGTLGVVGGSPLSGPTLVKFHHTATNHAEFIGNKFTQCWWQVPEASIGLSCDSVNSEITLDTCSFQTGKKGVSKRLIACGWFLELNADNRGVNTYNFTKTIQRTIASATITQHAADYYATMVLDPSTPANKQLTDQDIGEPLVCGAFTAYIQRIDTPFTAILSFHPTSTLTSQPVDMYRWNDFADTAYAAYHLDLGAVNQCQIIGGADEGYDYTLVVSSASLSADTYFQSYTAQGRFALNGATKLTVKNCALASCAFEDNTSAEDVVVVMDNCEWRIGTCFQATLWVTKAWRRYDSSTRKILESGIQPRNDYDVSNVDNYSFPYVNTQGNAFKIIDPNYSLVEGRPFLGLGSTSASTNYPFIRLGRVQSADPDKWLYYYEMTRDNVAGHMQFTGNQNISFRGYDFDAIVAGPSANFPLINSDNLITSSGAIRSLVKSSTAGFGYGIGAGDATVIQITSRSTPITVNAMCGFFQLMNSSLAASTFADVLVSNNCVNATDLIAVQVQGAVGTVMPFVISVGAGSFTIRQWNLSTTTADTLPLFVKFSVIKGSHT